MNALDHLVCFLIGCIALIFIAILVMGFAIGVQKLGMGVIVIPVLGLVAWSIGFLIMEGMYP